MNESYENLYFCLNLCKNIKDNDNEAKIRKDK